MPDDIAPREGTVDPARDRLQPLLIVCVLATLSLIIAFLGATPARVSATELLGETRAAGDEAFIASHRGGGATAPENTLPAISAALAAGFDYVEVDVALTADRQPVLMHDATVDRTTDGHGRLSSLTLAQVQGAGCRARGSTPTYAGTRGAHLRRVPRRAGRHGAACDRRVEGRVGCRGRRRPRWPRSRPATSSDASRCRASMPAPSRWPASASTVLPRLFILKHLPPDVVRAATEAGVRGLVVDRRAILERPEVVDELHAAGIRVVVYTLNSDTQWDEVTALGVDGIVTDDPATLSTWQQGVAGEQ